MIDSIKYSTISRIYVKDLIFYDEQKETSLKEMCNYFGITYLPGKDRRSCYKLENGRFHKASLTEEMTCFPYDRLFDQSTLNKFETGNHDEVMFVMEDQQIKGVVHIVDYNSEFINLEFFKITLYFEKMLRELLILKKESNASVIEWMKSKADQGKSFWKKRHLECSPIDSDKNQAEEKRRRELSPFQTFYLNDLLFFIASKKFTSKLFRKNIEAVKGIRNWVAHNQDLAHKSNTPDHPLYRIDELKTFIKQANQFFMCFEELEELVRSERQKTLSDKWS